MPIGQLSQSLEVRVRVGARVRVRVKVRVRKLRVKEVVRVRDGVRFKDRIFISLLICHLILELLSQCLNLTLYPYGNPIFFVCF
jgi:hypothetical protein